MINDATTTTEGRDSLLAVGLNDPPSVCHVMHVMRERVVKSLDFYTLIGLILATTSTYVCMYILLSRI
jgi:hypothetical protein